MVLEKTLEFEQTTGDSDGQESLACCSPWGRKESDMTERLNNKNKSCLIRERPGVQNDVQRTVAFKAPQSMGFPRQEYWSWLPFPSPGDLPAPGIEPRPPALQADSLLPEPAGKPGIKCTKRNL